MPKNIRNVTIPPKVEPEEIFARFDPVARGIVAGLHAGLMQLSEAPWIDDDYYDTLLLLWRSVTKVAFRDTLPTYTLEIDGKPVTGAMIAETLGSVQAIRPPEVMEAYLQAEPISIFGVTPTMSDESKPTAEQQTQETAANMGGPPNTAGAPAPTYDTTQAEAAADLYYNKDAALEKAHAVIDTADAQEKAAQEKAAENAPAPEVDNEPERSHGKHGKHSEESSL